MNFSPSHAFALAQGELIVDSFAGGGGASLGIEMAVGRSPDIAINHDAEALSMHAANHPATLHLPHNVWKVDPSEVCRGRPVGLLWASPDCKHHSKAKGGKPVKREIRDLAWVVVRWARQVRPRVIFVENVEEFRDWGPLTAEARPCPERRGQTFAAWRDELQRLGYRVEYRDLRACDYGAPTIRKRLFVIARRDGQPIVWPAPTHGAPDSPDVLAGKLKPWRTAAEIIDWSLPCPSIFLSKDEARAIGAIRPLAENTMARIAKGVKRYVLEAAMPFIVPITHTSDQRCHGIGDPLRTVTTAKGGEHALVAPFFVPRYGERPGQEPRTRSVEAPSPVVVPTANGGSLVAPHLMTMRNSGKPFNGADEPTHTVTAGGAGLSLVAAFLAQHNAGPRPGAPAHSVGEPMSTVTSKGSQQAVVSAGMLNLKGSDRGGRAVDDPLATICAAATHAAEVRAFLVKYYGNEVGGGHGLDEPTGAATTKDRFGLVTVTIDGEPYALVDIGMRMLTPRELFRAQGFPDSYRIDAGERAGERVPLTKTAQVRMCGNSVCPDVASALVAANYAAPVLPASPRRAPAPLPLFEVPA